MPDFKPGFDEEINIELRNHPDNPAAKMLDEILEYIENHPDKQTKKAAESND